MGGQFVTAGQGLFKIFCGELLASVAAVALGAFAQRLGIAVLLYLAAAVSIAGFLLVLAGLEGAAVAHTGFRSALWYVGANVLISIPLRLDLLPGLRTVLTVASLAAGLLTVFLICKSASALLTEKGREEQAGQGANAWKGYFVCIAASTGCSLAAAFLYGAPAGVALSLLYLLLQAAAECVYLVFLYRAQRALRRR